MSDAPSPADQRMADAVRQRAKRHRRARDLPSFARNFGQIGVLGWQIVVPALLGLAGGRWLDHRLASGIFWTAALMTIGITLGCWSAWKWVQRQ